jgi:hypothetical protein
MACQNYNTKQSIFSFPLHHFLFLILHCSPVYVYFGCSFQTVKNHGFAVITIRINATSKMTLQAFPKTSALLTKWMLVPRNAIYTETRLISNTQPALAQDAQCLSLGWQHYLPQPLVPGLGAGYFIDYQLGGVLYTASNAQIYHTVHSNYNKPVKI